VNVTIGGPVCVVPSLAGKTAAEAKTALEAAGCKLGDVTTGPPGKPEDAGKITTQTPPAGDKVPSGTKVDVTVNPPACVVPNLAGKTEAEAKAALEAAGCKLGDVTPGADDLTQAGKVVDQGPRGGTAVPTGTEVNVTVAGPVCNVPGLSGMTEADAKTKVEAAGCVLATTQRNTDNVSDVGKVLDQSPPAATLVPKGSTINATVGVQVAGLLATRQDSDSSPTLVRTGGIALGGLALWLLISGLLTQLAGSERLWRLVRRVRG
jgi:serine/threonine-protein kinase